MSVDRPVALVTGATSGLGEALAVALARQGWTMLVHGRDRERAAEVADRLKREGAAEARAYVADFSSLKQVRAMAARIRSGEDRLDLLVNNAGILEAKAASSEDGNDLVMQVNYLAPYLLTGELQSLLAQDGGGAVVNVASAGQWALDLDDFNIARRWSAGIAYGRSKLAMIMWTLGAASDLARMGIRINAIHPATLMPTRMTAEVAQVAARRPLGRILARWLKPRSTLEEGVANVLRLVDLSRSGQLTGAYFKGEREARPHRQARDERAWTRLDAISRERCGRAADPL